MAHKTTLKIDGSSYNVLECEYEFIQPVKENGQPSARPTGGLISFTIVLPDDKDMCFYEWMLNKTELKDGMFDFEVMNGGKITHKTISFKNAYCIRLYEYFSNADNAQMYMKITISAAEISHLPPVSPLDYRQQESEREETRTTSSVKEVTPQKPKSGGAHEELNFDRTIAEGKKRETVEQRHHIPSQAAGNKGGKGGAITMETDDHKKTASYDSLDGSDDYRNSQKKLVDEGKFEEAFEMDVKDIQEKFGDKYNDAIDQLREWYKSTGKF